MNIRTSSISFLFLFLVSWEGLCQNLEHAQGYVYEDLNGNLKRDKKEPGISGALVSDGCQVVCTDENGHWEMDVNGHCVIFLIKPKGYISPTNEKGQPESWYIHKVNGSPVMKFKGSEPTGPLPKSLDFALKKYEDPRDFSFFIFGDPQPYTMKEMEWFDKGIVEEASKVQGPSFGISLGDICGERMDMYPEYLDVMKKMNRPWYNVIGNHDRNYDSGCDSLANESFEAAFGPSTYAFRYGDTHFICMDDIYFTGEKANPYWGGFSERQFKFLENYLKCIDPDDQIIVSYHIPINYKKGQFLDSHRRRFFKIFEGRKVMGLSAHTHIQMQFYCDESVGWTGVDPYYEYNVATSNGDWYSGHIGKDGTPESMMRDGTPKGYAVATMKDGKLTWRYKVASMPDSCQMRAWGAKVVPYKQGGKYPLYVNFFAGGERDTVKFRIDGGRWKLMTKVADEPDPAFLYQCYEWDTADHVMEGRRPAKPATMCTHLWKSFLDNKLEPGEHVVDIKVIDQFGRKHSDKFLYRTEKFRPVQD